MKPVGTVWSSLNQIGWSRHYKIIDAETSTLLDSFSDGCLDAEPVAAHEAVEARCKVWKQAMREKYPDLQSYTIL